MNNKVTITYTYWLSEQKSCMIKHAMFFKKKYAINSLKNFKRDFVCIILEIKSCLKNIIKTTFFYHHNKS